MVLADIQKGLDGFAEPLTSQTYLYTYKVQGRDSLLSDGLGTRANSIWKMAQYIVAKYDGKNTIPIEQYLSGWETLTRNYGNQYLIIAVDEFNWEMYDSNCKCIGRNDDITSYLRSQTKPVEQRVETNSSVQTIPDGSHENNDNRNIQNYIPYLAALRTKPFMLLAGISGTGKSRIVRELAKACWKEGDEEYGKNHPRNFCMVQVKPNWHDSSELIGYVSRIGGAPQFVVGPFLRFLAAALKEPDVPYFLCLDEMNLAPVEQYFAEYLSVIESRKLNVDPVSGQTVITTDPIIDCEGEEWHHSLIAQLFGDKERMSSPRLTIPQNLFVVGTVNMDETTFAFSRKVLDRAMTIEMNAVDLHGGLEKGAGNELGYIGNCIIGQAAEGCDVYADHRELCDQVLAYLEQVNAILEGTPFKIAYRTRNEFLMYAVNRQLLAPDSQLWQSLDEMTSMKVLSRVEGDEDRTKRVLNGLKELVDTEITQKIPTAEGGQPRSISAGKIDEMLKKLAATGFTSYWT